MRTKIPTAVGLLGCTLMLAGASAQPLELPPSGPRPPAPRFTIVDLGAAPGGASWGMSINDAGQVAGYARAAAATARAARWDVGAPPQDLGLLVSGPGPNYSFGYGIGPSGQVVGQSYGSGVPSRAFIWVEGAGMRDLGVPPGHLSSSATAVNGVNQVVGSSVTTVPGVSGTVSRAFVWQDGSGMRDLGTLPGGYESYANAINSSGQVVGGGATSGVGRWAFSWTAGGGMRELQGLAGAAFSTAYGLNGPGLAVGESGAGGATRAVLWDAAGAVRALDQPSGGSARARATAINDAGSVVGSFYQAAVGDRAFYWDTVSGTTDLNTLIDGANPYTSLLWAQGINNSGQIVGYGSLADGSLHAYLLNPVAVPEPAGWLLALFGGAWLCAVVRGRRRSA